MTGKKVSADDVFKHRADELRADYEADVAFKQTPEGKAAAAVRESIEARKRAADERFAAENPPDHYHDGVSAALAGQGRDPPAGLDEDQEEAWLSGYDSESPPDIAEDE